MKNQKKVQWENRALKNLEINLKSKYNENVRVRKYLHYKI